MSDCKQQQLVKEQESQDQEPGLTQCVYIKNHQGQQNSGYTNPQNNLLISNNQFQQQQVGTNPKIKILNSSTDNKQQQYQNDVSFQDPNIFQNSNRREQRINEIQKESSVVSPRPTNTQQQQNNLNSKIRIIQKTQDQTTSAQKIEDNQQINNNQSLINKQNQNEFQQKNTNQINIIQQNSQNDLNQTILRTIVRICFCCGQSISENIKQLQCQHSYHEQCLLQQIYQQIAIGQPVQYCNCKQKIHQHTVLQSLKGDSNQINQYFDNQLGFLINKNKFLQDIISASRNNCKDQTLVNDLDVGLKRMKGNTYDIIKNKI